MTREESAQIIKRCISRSSKTITDQDGDIDGKDIGQRLIKNLVQFESMSFGRPYKSVEGKQKQKIVAALAEGFDTRKTALERKGSQNQKCSPVSETSRRKWDCRESGQTLSTFKRASVHLCASFQTLPRGAKKTAMLEVLKRVNNQAETDSYRPASRHETEPKIGGSDGTRTR